MRKGRTRLPLVRAEPGAPSVKVKIVRILTSESIALSVGVAFYGVGFLQERKPFSLLSLFRCSGFRESLTQFHMVPKEILGLSGKPVPP